MLVLRIKWPQFWVSLNRVWRDCDLSPARLLNPDDNLDNLTQLDGWIIEHRVVDEWLLAVVAATITAWNEDPSGPNASLYPGFHWYRVSHESIEQDWEPIEDFAPVFDDPYPKGRNPTEVNAVIESRYENPLPSSAQDAQTSRCMEPLEHFERRMETQFRAQLTAYVKSARNRYYKINPQTLSHAKWTVLFYSGMSYAEISKKELYGGYLEQESTVRMAVIRFAERIGLTLPPSTNVGNIVGIGHKKRGQPGETQGS